MRISTCVALFGTLALAAVKRRPSSKGVSRVAMTDSTPSHDQQVGIASYLNPVTDSAIWNRIISYDNGKVTVLVANVANGPDYKANNDWKTVIDKAAAQGKTVIGYVRTGYLGINAQRYTTRLGSHDLADWAAQIMQDVEMWYHLYGDSIGGIFFDEAWNQCGPNNQYAELYALINRFVKERHSDAFTVLNPGMATPQCFEETMDTLMTFESSYQNYTTSYVPNTWIPSDPLKIWHLIYNVAEDKIAAVAKLAQDRGAGIIQITDGKPPNPYNTFPNENYMKAVITAVKGGDLSVEFPRIHLPESSSCRPPKLRLKSADYSSASLSWTASDDASVYRVYLNNKYIMELPPYITNVTVGMLDPGKSYKFEAVAVVGDGDDGEREFYSDSLNVRTKDLPGGQALINANATSVGGATTYTADVLLPYSAARLYVWYSTGLSCTDAAWPIGYNVTGSVCAKYLVDGNRLHKYSGTNQRPAEWNWIDLDEIPVQVSGYTHKWTIPYRNETFDTTKFIVQVQGYSPPATLYAPNP